MASLRKCFVFLTSQTGKHFMCQNGRRVSLQQSAAHMTWARTGMVTKGRKLSLLQRRTEISDLSKTFTHDSHKTEGHDATPQKLSDTALNCRLAAENGFLSWTRNGYISCVAGCALLSHAQTEGMVDAVFGVFFISYMNMTCGTAVYLWNLLSMRSRVQMSSPLTMLYVVLTLAHFVIYTAAMVVFHDEFDSTKLKGLEHDESEPSQH